MCLLSKLLKQGGAFVDVGANIGLYSLTAARLVGETGRVVAFEPSPRERATLVANLARNRLSHVTVDARALGAAENARGVLHLADDQHGGQNTLGSVVYENVRLVADAEIEMTTLDSALAEHGLEQVGVVKIDVEGAESAVLSGARHVLDALRPVLMLELQQDSLLAQGSSAPEVVELLSGHGYEVYRYADQGGGHLLRRLEEADTTVAQDVVAVPAESSGFVLSL
jgi:FkbM family methyltransferase